MSRQSRNTNNNDDDDNSGSAISNSIGAIRDPTLEEVCENIMNIPIKTSQKTTEKYETKIIEQFKYFERPSKDSQSCDVRDVGTIIRALNLTPTESTVMKIVEDAEEAESTGYIKYEKLKPILLKCLMEREYYGQILEREDEQLLRCAFAAFDREGKGWLDAYDFKSLLEKSRGFVTEENTNNNNNSENNNAENNNNNAENNNVTASSARSTTTSNSGILGEPLTKEEMETLMEAVLDPETGRVNIDDYVSLLLES